MMDKQIDLLKLFKLVLSNWRKIAISAVISLFVGLIIAISIPKEFTTTVKVATENKKNQSSSMSGIAAMMGVGMGNEGLDGINEKIYPEIIRSVPFVNEFRTMRVPYKGNIITLEEYLIDNQRRTWWSYILGLPSTIVGLFSSDNDNSEISEGDNVYAKIIPTKKERSFVGILSSKLFSIRDSKTGIYQLSVKMQDPLISAIVADSLTVKLQEYMSNYFTQKAQKDLAFNMKLLEEAKGNYYYRDSLYSQMVDRNKNLISLVAQIKIEKLRNEREIAFSVYQQVANQVEMTKMKVQEDTPIITIIEPARMPNVATPSTKLLLLAFAFLGAFLYTAFIVIKAVVKE